MIQYRPEHIQMCIYSSLVPSVESLGTRLYTCIYSRSTRSHSSQLGMWTQAAHVVTPFISYVNNPQSHCRAVVIIIPHLFPTHPLYVNTEIFVCPHTHLGVHMHPMSHPIQHAQLPYVTHACIYRYTSIITLECLCTCPVVSYTGQTSCRTSLTSKRLKTTWATIQAARYNSSHVYVHVGTSHHTCSRPTYWWTDAF